MIIAMDHEEAVETMAAELYLLDELTPEARDAFEEHMFDCQKCALELHVGTAFIQESKAQLAAMESPAPVQTAAPQTPERKRRGWSWLWQPSFAAPAFALLVGVIAYQNFATIPGLRSAAHEPRLVPWTSLHAGSRAGGVTPLLADPRQGAMLLLDISQDSDYASYSFELYDPHNNRVWSQTLNSSSLTGNDGGSVSLLIPGAGLQQGRFTLVIAGLNAGNERRELDRRVLDVQFK